MLIAAVVVQAAVMVGAPVAVVLWLRRRWGPGAAPWGLVGAGALAFVGSQVVHIPLNMGLTALFARGLLPVPPPAWQLAFNAAVLGLTAGLCEEPARYLVLRAWKRDARSWREAVALGAGHGGIESVVLGLGAAFQLVNMWTARGMDLAAAGAPPEAAALVAAYLATPAHHALLGGAERLMVMTFHVGASTIVMTAVARRRPSLLAVAVLLHATLNGVAVWTMARFGVVAAEAAMLPVLALAGAALWATRRALPVAPVVSPERAAAAEAERAARAASPADVQVPIEVHAAHKLFPGGVRALAGASFRIAAGEHACLLGPNGAGKTTMLRLLTGALAPTNGLVRLFGKEAHEPAFLAAKRRVGIVPQQPGMYRDVTAREWLAFVHALYGRGRVTETVDLLGLGEFLDRPMADLSGGTQRRLALASALLSEPDLLLLDEPSVGLDPVAAADVRAYLGRAMEGRTVLLCTHNLAEAEDLCSTVVILRAGNVLLHEPIARLRARAVPKLRLRAAQGPEALAAEVGRLGHAPDVEDESVLVAVADPERAAPVLLRALLGAGLDVHTCAIERPSLEEMFLDVVGRSGAGDVGR